MPVAKCERCGYSEGFQVNVHNPNSHLKMIIPELYGLLVMICDDCLKLWKTLLSDQDSERRRFFNKVPNYGNNQS